MGQIKIVASILIIYLFLSICLSGGINAQEKRNKLNGVIIYPVIGASDNLSILIAELIIAKLVSNGYAAYMPVNGNPSELTLVGAISTIRGGGVPIRLLVNWALYDNRGGIITQFKHGYQGSLKDLYSKDHHFIEIIIDVLYPDLHPFLFPNLHRNSMTSGFTPVLTQAEIQKNKDKYIDFYMNTDQYHQKSYLSTMEEHTSSFNPEVASLFFDDFSADIKLWVEEVTGAPGDGNVALTRALNEQLKRKQLNFAIASSLASHFIEGIVDIDAKSISKESVTITWVIKNRFDQEIGRVVQKNEVERGLLHGTWGDIAEVITYAGIDGITNVLSGDGDNY